MNCKSARGLGVFVDLFVQQLFRASRDAVHPALAEVDMDKQGVFCCQVFQILKMGLQELCKNNLERLHPHLWPAARVIPTSAQPQSVAIAAFSLMPATLIHP